MRFTAETRGCLKCKIHPGLHEGVDVRTDDFLRTKIFWMHRLRNFLTRGAPLRALRAAESSAVKTGIRCIKRLDQLSFEIRLERRTTKGSSSGRIMRLVPAFILETHNQTNYDTAYSVTVLLVQ